METTRKPDAPSDARNAAKPADGQKAPEAAKPEDNKAPEPRFAERVQEPMVNPRPGQTQPDKPEGSAVEPRRMPPPVESVTGMQDPAQIEPGKSVPEDKHVMPVETNMAQRGTQLPEFSEPAGPPPNSPYRTGVAGEFPPTASTSEGIKLMVPEGHYAIRHTTDPYAVMPVGQPGPEGTGIWFIPYNAITQAWAHGFERLSDRDIDTISRTMEIAQMRDDKPAEDKKPE
ncbi:MAG: hypothetical protein AB7H90_01395 [Alphaproteobacteria bacterium]